MTGYAFDIETNAVNFSDLPGTLKTIHCIVLINLETGQVHRYNDKASSTRLYFGIQRLEEATLLVGQNIMGFDIPALKVKYPELNLKATIRDTKVMSQLIYPDLKDKDFSYTVRKNPDFPKHLIGSHSLEAWGHRLGDYKDDFSKRMKELGLDPWGDLPPEYEKEREDYCVQDVKTNITQYNFLQGKGFSEDAIQLEHDVRQILNRQESYGFAFDMKAASALQSKLVKRKLELIDELQGVFKPFIQADGKGKSFKKDMRRWKDNPYGGSTRVKKGEATSGYYETVTGGLPDISPDGTRHRYTYQPIKLVEFNPGSRAHIANRLQKLYGWKPKAFGNDGIPTVDEAVLCKLKYPPVKLLLEYLLINKRLGQLAEGKESCMHHEKNGRIHGKVNTMGAVTSRMTHSKPNIAQTPSNSAPYGKEFRACYTVKHGYRLVGCDADALELRMLAGYMAKWDGGDYINVVLNGSKEDGTDIHSRNRDAIGLNARDAAKTWFYAFIYGAGDYKLGTIIAGDMPIGQRPRSKREITELGAASRSNFEKNLPALGTLVTLVKAACKRSGRIRGLDGRFHPTRAEHAALNTLLQGAGAIIMKRALVIADEKLQALGFKNSINHVMQEDYEFVANIHDELQVEAKEDLAGAVAGALEESLVEAGEYYEFACPITGSSAIGVNWSETH